jgi:predicted MFS family arabinose efflux permease
VTPRVTDDDVERVGWAAYRHLWRTPGAPRLLTGYTLARLPTGLVALTLALATLQRTGSFPLVGVVDAAYAVGMGVGGPVAGRLVDTRGARRVLACCGLAYPLSLLGFAAITSGWLDAPAWMLPTFAALAGLALPPVAPVTRSTWAGTLDATARRAQYAVESMLVQVFYTAGPAFVGLLAFWHATWWALVVSAAFNMVGVILVAGSALVRALPISREKRHRLAALRQPGTAVVMVLSAGYMIGATAVDFALIAWADERGAPGLVGLVLAASCVGALVASVGYGAGWAALHRLTLRRVFALWACSLALIAVAVGLDAGLGWVIAAVTVSEAVSAPLLPLLIEWLTDACAPNLRTETFSWRVSAQMVGASAGAAVCGPAAAHGAWGPSLIGVGVAATGAALAARRAKSA